MRNHSFAPTAALLEARLTFAKMQPQDLLAIDVQDSQATFLGEPADIDEETAYNLAAQPVAWTALRADGSVLACFGFNEVYPGRHGTAWALIGKDIGRDHLALTRFVRKVVANCTLPRLDVLARANYPGPDWRKRTEWYAHDMTAEVRWCLLLGFYPATLLGNFGGAGEAFILFERLY